MEMKQRDERQKLLEAAIEALERGRSVEEVLAALPARWQQDLRAEVRSAAWLLQKRKSLQRAAAGKHLPPMPSFPLPQRKARRWARLGARRIGWQWMGALVLVLLVLMGTATTAFAQQALPGEPLYTVKRTMETWEMYLPMSESARASRWLTFAERRLSEAEEEAKRGQVSEVETLLEAYTQDVAHAEQAGANAKAHGGALPRGWYRHLEQHQQRLRALETALPLEARVRVHRALQFAMHLERRWRGEQESPDVGSTPTPHTPPAAGKGTTATVAPTATPKSQEHRGQGKQGQGNGGQGNQGQGNGGQGNQGQGNGGKGNQGQGNGGKGKQGQGNGGKGNQGQGNGGKGGGKGKGGG